MSDQLTPDHVYLSVIIVVMICYGFFQNAFISSSNILPGAGRSFPGAGDLFGHEAGGPVQAGGAVRIIGIKSTVSVICKKIIRHGSM